MKQFLKKIIVSILIAESKLALLRYKPKIVAITGSVGKTSTKDAVYTALSSDFYVRKSQKSFNSEIGIPLTILGCRNAWNSIWGWTINIFSGLWNALFSKHYPEWLVLEIGADRPGDIKSVAKWLNPQIVVYTKMSKVPVHVEFFKNAEHVFEEKASLAEAVRGGGWIILNADDEQIMTLANKAENVLTYGSAPDANIKGSDYSIRYNESGIPLGITFNVTYKGETVRFDVNGSLGGHHIYPILGAISVALSQNIKLHDLAVNFGKHETPAGRMKIVPGIKNSIIIDDTYNSSPIALKEALETLGSIKAKGKKIAILGDMLELGKHSSDEHKKAGILCAKYANVLVTVGLRARGIAEGALNSEMSEKDIYQFDNSQEAGKFTEQLIGKGDVILAKGSQSIRVEKAVEEIMSEPEKAGELLVRQEKEWKGR